MRNRRKLKSGDDCEKSDWKKSFLSGLPLYVGAVGPWIGSIFDSKIWATNNSGEVLHFDSTIISTSVLSTLTIN